MYKEVNDNLRFFLHQDPEIVDLKNKFWQYVEDVSFSTDEDCWLWVGPKDKDNYGRIWAINKECRAHRVSYWIYRDLCQSRLLLESKPKILHKCDSTSCINPNHLFKGTNWDNTLDMINKGRHPRMKLKLDQIKEVKNLYSSGLTQEEVARKFNVNQSQVSRIINEHIWKH